MTEHSLECLANYNSNTCCLMLPLLSLKFCHTPCQCPFINPLTNLLITPTQKMPQIFIQMRGGKRSITHSQPLFKINVNCSYLGYIYAMRIKLKQGSEIKFGSNFWINQYLRISRETAPVLSQKNNTGKCLLNDKPRVVYMKRNGHLECSKQEEPNADYSHYHRK